MLAPLFKLFRQPAVHSDPAVLRGSARTGRPRGTGRRHAHRPPAPDGTGVGIGRHLAAADRRPSVFTRARGRPMSSAIARGLIGVGSRSRRRAITRSSSSTDRKAGRVMDGARAALRGGVPADELAGGSRAMPSVSISGPPLRGTCNGWPRPVRKPGWLPTSRASSPAMEGRDGGSSRKCRWHYW